MKSPLALLRRAFAMVFSLILLGALVPAMLSSAQAAVASVDFGQCANQPSAPHDCEWINGALNASKAVYAENMSVPQRTMLTAITPTLSTQHSLVFTTQWTKGGQHAFDWLTSYAQAQASATFYGVPFGAMNECADISNVATCTALRAGSFADVAVPDDAYVSADGATQPHINAYETQFGNRTIRLYGTGITINSLTMAHPAGTDTGDTEATWTLTWTGNAPAVLLEMAAHVAASTGAVGWGTGTGASTISGSPYHVSLATLDGSALGSQDNQMSANVIVAPGFIQVTKSLSPTDDPGTFNLQVDSVTRATGVGNGGTTGLVQVLPGQHSVGELAATGTSLSNYDSTVACGNDQPAVGTTATVDVDEGETVSCTITNTRQAAPTGSLEVVKNLEPSNDPGLFDLLVDGTTQATDVTDAGTTGPLAVSVGSHTFGEAAGTGTSLSDYTTGVAWRDPRPRHCG
jgi:hypothetical protein